METKETIMQKRFIKSVFVIAVFGLLAGCSATSRNVEMPYEPEDSDALRPSPCACVEYTEYYDQFTSMEG